MALALARKIMLLVSSTVSAVAIGGISIGTNNALKKIDNDTTIKLPGDDNNNDSSNGNKPDGDNTTDIPNNGNNQNTSKRIEITKQPRNVSLTYNTSGSINFEYQAYNLSSSDKIFIVWYKDGKPLQNETDTTISFSKVSFDNAGKYYAKISIGNYLFFQTEEVTLTVNEDFSNYDGITFAGGTPLVYFYTNYNKLKIDAFVYLTKDGTNLPYNGEKIKIEFYIDNTLIETQYTSKETGNILFCFKEGSYSSFENKEIKVVASFGSFTKTATTKNIIKATIAQ